MINNNILLVEDDERSGKLIKDVLSVNNYEVTLSINGKEALNEFKKNPFSIVITDLEMPVMGGRELIGHLNEFENKPVIFVATAHYEAQLIIDIMKKGVYDYLIKPVDVNDLLIKIKRALETYDLRQMKHVVEKERIIRLEKQLEWSKWQERMKHKKSGQGSSDKTMFQNLKTSFSQGAGFGSLTTLLNMVISSAKEEGEHYIINIERSLMDLLKDNAKMADKAVKVFTDIEWIISHELDMDIFTFDGLYEYIIQIINLVSEYTQIKKHSILLSEKKSGLKVKNIRINEDFFSRALSELLINAMKFSEENSKIFILYDCDSTNEGVSISIINKSNPKGDTNGIPPEYSNLIFEPFFRITNNVDERYGTLDFGLGLTAVEKIIEKHSGKITATNILDHTSGSNPETKANFTITIPFAE